MADPDPAGGAYSLLLLINLPFETIVRRMVVKAGLGDETRWYLDRKSAAGRSEDCRVSRLTKKRTTMSEASLFLA